MNGGARLSGGGHDCGTTGVLKNRAELLENNRNSLAFSQEMEEVW